MSGNGQPGGRRDERDGAPETRAVDDGQLIDGGRPDDAAPAPLRPVVELVEPGEIVDEPAALVGAEASAAGGDLVRGRLARFAAVAEAPQPSRLISTLPPGPRPLTPLDRLRLFLTGRLTRSIERRASRRRQAALVGALTGLGVGIVAVGIAHAWQERDTVVGLTLTLLATGSSLFVWWRQRSTTAAAAHLGMLLLVLWLLTPASHIIYESDRDTGFRSQIYVTTANGGSTDRLSSSPTLEMDARLSPNGRQIALAHHQDGNADIYITENDGANPRNLTKNPAEDRAPTWSPDGGEIAFQSNRGGNWDIFVMQSDGRNLRKVTNSPADDEAPAWSPDGRTLLFQSDRSGFTQIYVLGQRGSVVPLTRGLYDNAHPAWSPDGGLIAFQTNRDGRWQLYVMRPDGSDARRVIESPGNAMMPAWSPTGRSLVFVSDRDGDQDLYSVRADGTGLRRLTDTPTNESRPAWLGTSPINIVAARRTVLSWLGFIIPALQPGETIVAVAPPAPRDEPAGTGQPLAPGEDVLPYATPRPAPLPAPGVQLQPTPTPGPKPVPTCAPGSVWC
jgi:TolB protein